MFIGAVILALLHPLSEKRLAKVQMDLQEMHARTAAQAAE
jgi:Na+/melibiose symporter-like transporter